MPSLPDILPYDQWISSIFSHPETNSDYSFWWDDGYDPSMWDEQANPDRAVEFMTRLFSSPGFLLEHYTPHQVNAGLYYMASPGSSCYMHCLRNESIAWDKRRACIKSIADLYRDLWAPLYENNLIANTDSVGKLGLPQTACYMWWDVVVIWPGDDITNRNEFISAIFDVFEEGLRHSSEACLESILHGIGHYYDLAPGRAARLVDELLKRQNLSPELRRYALCAREGCVQ